MYYSPLNGIRAPLLLDDNPNATPAEIQAELDRLMDMILTHQRDYENHVESLENLNDRLDILHYRDLPPTVSELAALDSIIEDKERDVLYAEAWVDRYKSQWHELKLMWEIRDERSVREGGGREQREAALEQAGGEAEEGCGGSAARGEIKVKVEVTEQIMLDLIPAMGDERVSQWNIEL